MLNPEPSGYRGPEGDAWPQSQIEAAGWFPSFSVRPCLIYYSTWAYVVSPLLSTLCYKEKGVQTYCKDKQSTTGHCAFVNRASTTTLSAYLAIWLLFGLSVWALECRISSVQLFQHYTCNHGCHNHCMILQIISFLHLCSMFEKKVAAKTIDTYVTLVNSFPSEPSGCA